MAKTPPVADETHEENGAPVTQMLTGMSENWPAGQRMAEDGV